MSVVTKLVLTHVNGNDNVILMGDGAKFVLINGNRYTHTFTEADSAAIVKAITGIDTAVKKAKLAIGRNIPVKDKVISVLSEGAVIGDEINFQIFTTTISTKVTDTWPLTVINEAESIDFPAGVIDDLVKYLVANGVEKAPTDGLYDKILFVQALPTENIETTAAYVLDKADGDKPAGSVWVSAGEGEWDELSDEEQTEVGEDEGIEEQPIVVEGGGEGATGFEPGPAIP